MLFVAGATDRSGRRRLFCGECTPTVDNLRDFTEDAALFDWGADASEEAVRRTAVTILLCATDMHHAQRLSRRYGREVVRGMRGDKMWLLFHSEIEKWIRSRLMVA